MMDTPKLLFKSYFGKDFFRSLQEEIISHVMQRKHALVLMPFVNVFFSEINTRAIVTNKAYYKTSYELVHNGGETYARIIEEIDKAGYFLQTLLLNTADYGLPQKRYRVYIFARRKLFGKFSFSENDIKSHFEGINNSSCSLAIYKDVLDILSKQVAPKYYLSERVKPTILSDGTGGYKSHSEIDQIIARTLTATMNKMHRACQDNYYSDEFLLSNGKSRPSERMDKEELAKIPIRKLTPEEAFLLQGFPAEFVKNARKLKRSSCGLKAI